jgi:hypothetical protein
MSVASLTVLVASLSAFLADMAKTWEVVAVYPRNALNYATSTVRLATLNSSSALAKGRTSAKGCPAECMPNYAKHTGRGGGDSL